MSQPVAPLRENTERDLLDEQFSSFSGVELDLLFDEDESKLEEREAALAAIRQHVAAEMARLDKEQQDFRVLYARYDAIERNVKSLRRRRERINFRFPDGTRIFDLEPINDSEVAG